MCVSSTLFSRQDFERKRERVALVLKPLESRMFTSKRLMAVKALARCPCSSLQSEMEDRETEASEESRGRQ